MYVARKVGVIVMALLHLLFFDACALQHGNAHAVVAGDRYRGMHNAAKDTTPNAVEKASTDIKYYVRLSVLGRFGLNYYSKMGV